MDILQLLNMLLIFFIIVIVVLLIIYALIVFSNRSKEKKIKQKMTNGKAENTNTEKDTKTTSTGEIQKVNIKEFLQFDEIKDNMIIRKDGKQYVMVIECQGINYDLASEQEKISIEEGFLQFLNTLRYPIQFYVQTRSLNLKEIISQYKEKVEKINNDIRKIDVKIQEAKIKGNEDLIDQLLFEKRRQENVLAYGLDISNYVERIMMNKKILQQNTYLVLSYYAAEIGSLENYSKEEIDSMCFSELYTRCQTSIRALASCGVTGSILDSEGLAELLYIAYNRDDAETMQLSSAIDAGYDALYSTSKDVLDKKKKILDEQIEDEAADLAAQTIVDVEEKIQKENRKKRVREEALKMVKDYKDQIDKEVYEETVKELTADEENKTEESKKNTVRRKPKTSAQ